MKAPIYNVYPCSEGGGRYKFVVRGRLGDGYTRKYFSTKHEAVTWIEIKNIEIQNQGKEHAEFPTALRLQAQSAARLLEPHGVSLLDAVRIALPILETRGKSIPVPNAVERFLEDYRLHGGPKAAIPSTSYLKDLRDMLSPFKSSFPETLVADVGTQEVEDFIAGRKGAGAVTRQSYVRAISAFYGWCVRKGYRLDNPLAKLRKKLPKTEPSILTVADAERVMRCALPDEVAFLTLALFCGIRIAEFHKIVRDSRGEERAVWLEWKDVDLRARQVFISPALDKNRHGRYVEIAANGVAWLVQARGEDAVMPENWKERRQALEQRAAVALPQNVLRHSFCSYRIALDQDYAKAAATVGNSPAMPRKHYVLVLPKKLGQDFFKIIPTTRATKKAASNSKAV